MKTTTSAKDSVFKKVSGKIKILLADDDTDDCLLFKEALDELPLLTQLNIVKDGEELIEELHKKRNKLPDVVFLDLYMPRKNGFASLGLIKDNSELQNIPVIIFTTSSDIESFNQVFKDAAHYYICKPVDFSHLKKIIYEALSLIIQNKNHVPLKENFMITGDSIVIPQKT